MKEFETEEVQTKGKMIAVTTLSVIIAIVLLIITGIFSVKSFFDSLFSKKEYFVLNVNDENRDTVIELFEKEKENIFYSQNYCDSLYKIEYYHLFPDGTKYTMYCKNQDNITFSIDYAGEDVLATYIYENGKREMR